MNSQMKLESWDRKTDDNMNDRWWKRINCECQANLATV